MANFKYNYIQCGFSVSVILEKFIMSFKKKYKLSLEEKVCTYF